MQYINILLQKELNKLELSISTKKRTHTTFCSIMKYGCTFYDLEKNVVLIKGSVPGANNSFVIVSNGVKANTPSVNPAAFEKGE